ncbi:MAG: helix-turn-helix domain-containing protein [Candidatus Obscuribacterales bacterium]|nr:helix-turn-helix domain-containing protein [Candidatus Obscuribacterales bacterium]
MNSAKDVRIDPVNIDGLDEVFQNGSSQIADLRHPDSKNDNGLNIKEAAKHYDLSVASIRLKIKLGEIPAIKVSGKSGPEWAIFPNGIPNNYQKDDSTVDGVYYQADNKVIEGSHQATSTVVEEGLEGGNSSIEALKQANTNLGKFLDMQRELIN